MRKEDTQRSLPTRNKSSQTAETINVFGKLQATLQPKYLFLTTLHLGSRNWKITAYNFQKLVRYTAVFTLWVRGTVFYLDRTIYTSMIAYSMCFAITFVLVYIFWYNDKDIDYLETYQLPAMVEISDDVQKFATFLLGLFISVILSRWWSLRIDGVGAMANQTVNVSGLLVSTASRILHSQQDWERFRVIHARIVKYDDILTDAEKNILATRTCHAYCLWCWITALTVEIFEMLKMPAPNHNMVFQEVRIAMAGIHNIMNFLRTQLPFPYVHMITLIVNVHNIVLAVEAGFGFSLYVYKEQWQAASIKVFKLVMLPVMFQGLLQICVFLSDPFGDDIIDFPIRQYQHEMGTACADQLCCRELYEARWRDGVSPLPNANVCKSLPSANQPTQPPAAPDPPAQQVFSNLDQRLAALAQSNDALAASMVALQERLSQRSASWMASAESLQAQIKELSAAMSGAAYASSSAEMLGKSRQPTVMATPWASCCTIDHASAQTPTEPHSQN